MSLPDLPPELISHILSYVPPSWHWGNLGWDSDRWRRTVANNVRWFLRLRLVCRTFDGLVIDLVLAELRAGNLHRSLPLKRGAARRSTIAFVERLLWALVIRTAAAPPMSHENERSIARTIVDGAALSADFLTCSRESETRQNGSNAVDEEDEEANKLRDVYTGALISSLTIILGPNLVLDILEPGQDHGIDMFSPLNGDKQQWRITALMGAAYLGRVSDLKLILSLEIDINFDPSDRWLYPPVMAAAVAGRVDVLEFLAFQGADLHALTVGNGDNAVHFAALAGHTVAVERLIDKGVDCDVVNNDGVTPLHRAASAGHAGVVRALFTAKPEGLRTEIKDSLGRAAIHYAVERGYEDVVHAFLSRKDTDMEIQDAALVNPVVGRVVTPLLLAALTGRGGIFHAILARCGMPDPETIPRRTMCRVVIRGNSLAITKTVMERESKVYSEEDRNWLLAGETLCCAADLASDDVFRYLLSFEDAEIHHVPWKSGQPPEPTVLRAAISSNKVGHVRAVLDHPRFDAVRIFSPDTPKRSPLHYPTHPDGLDPAIMEALLAHPAFDVNVQDEFGRTPLHHAALTGQIELVKLLLAHPGVDIKRVDAQGKTPLCEAAERGHVAVARVFLEMAGPVAWDATPIDKSPLAFAVSGAKVDMVRVLLEPQYRIPRDVVLLEKGKAEKIITQNKADLAEWQRGVWDEKADWWFGNEEFREVFLESVELGVVLLHEMISSMSMRLEEEKENEQ
ncbi:ankyrin repeat-containing domain protein [Aspergillus oleicola]